jgi:hypothetical protein
MAGEKDDLKWAQDFVDRGALVMHIETRTVGKVVELFDGEGKKYTPPGQDRATLAPVIGMENGNTFVAKPGNFIELGNAERLFFAEAQAKLADCLADIAMTGGKIGVMAQTGALMLATVLRAQLRELERLNPGVRPPTA